MPSSSSIPYLLPLLCLTLVCIALLYSTLLSTLFFMSLFFFLFFILSLFFLFFSSHLIKQRYTSTGHSSTPRRASLPGEGFIKNGGKGCPYHTLGQCLSLLVSLFLYPLSLATSLFLSRYLSPSASYFLSITLSTSSFLFTSFPY